MDNLNLNMDNLVVGLDSLTITMPSEVKALECEQCGAKHKKPGFLIAHIENKHREECLERNDSIPPGSSLKVDFPCDICGKILSKQSNLTKHMKTQHKSHECDSCMESFSNKVALNEHYWIHPICNVCQKEYDTKYKLKRHMGTHK